MNTVSFLINIDPKVKVKAQKTAAKMGISLTSVINNYLKHFISTETITFSTNDKKPSQYLIDSIKESEADVKAGRVISFDKPKDAITYVNELIEHDKSGK